MRPTILLAWPKADYLASLDRAGAEPRVIGPAHDPVAELLSSDGLLLTGGADVDPSHYGDTDRHPTLALEPGRDAFELLLARTALAADIPVLAICRGVQLLNVAAGGSLYQDLPTHVPSDIAHRITDAADRIAHTVSVAPDSRLASLLGDGHDVVAVNSRHHQAVRTVAPRFQAVAHAGDGVIEAIECPSSSFCLGVQWHPENFWRTGEFSSLFDGLVDAARARATRRRGPDPESGATRAARQ